MIAFVAGLIFAACSDSDSPDNPLQPVPGQTTKAEREMGFSCRFAEPTTRAAGDGEYTTEMLKASGFGVYCWYTGSNHFDPAFTAPNTHIKDYLGDKGQLLMNNQKVVWDGTRTIWTYTPKKYWPINRDELLTLRAYAPYSSYVMTDVHGMPQLPVVLGTTTKNTRLYGNDYHEGSQHDPLWGTGRLVLPGGEYDREDGHEKYGSLYDNITYEMSGDYRLANPSEARNGTIDWFFHHGMSCLMFTCTVIADPGCDKVTIRSIEINDLYTRGLLSLSSPTATESEKPVWNQRDGNMRVRLSNADAESVDETDSTDLASKPLKIDITDSSQPTGPVNLIDPNKGLLIIPREFATGEGMKVTVSYTIDSETELLFAVGTVKRNFDGNTKYTVELKLTPATKGLEIEIVQSAFTPWYDGGTGEQEVYNW